MPLSLAVALSLCCQFKQIYVQILSNLLTWLIYKHFLVEKVDLSGTRQCHEKPFCRRAFDRNGSDVENVKDLAVGWGILMAFGASVLHTVNWHSIRKGTTELKNSLCPLVAAITNCIIYFLDFSMYFVDKV